MTDLPSDVGTIVHGSFRLSRVLGDDALGVRYAARDAESRKQVEVLVVAAARLAGRDAAFEEAADRMSRVAHEAVIPLLAWGRLPDGRAYRVTPWVGGAAMQGALAEPLLVSTAAGFARDVANGLAAAHAAGLIHGGLSPATVRLMKRTTPPDLALLADFGLYPLLEGSAVSSHGSTTAGGAAWMSPEYALGRPLTERSDLYALGAMLFHALTGRPPFVGPSMKVLAAHVSEPAPAPSSVITGVPHWLDELVLELLEKDPARRPSGAAEVAERLTDGAALLVDGAAHPVRVTANVAPVRLPGADIRGAKAHRTPEAPPRPSAPARGPVAAPAWAWGLGALAAVALVGSALAGLWMFGGGR